MFSGMLFQNIACVLICAAATLWLGWHFGLLGRRRTLSAGQCNSGCGKCSAARNGTGGEAAAPLLHSVRRFKLH